MDGSIFAYSVSYDWSRVEQIFFFVVFFVFSPKITFICRELSITILLNKRTTFFCTLLLNQKQRVGVAKEQEQETENRIISPQPPTVQKWTWIQNSDCFLSAREL